MRLFQESGDGLGSIGFPNIGIDEINPSDGFRLFGFEIKYYGVIIALGLLLAAFYAMRRAKQFGLTSDDILDIVLVGTPSAVIGARLYYVLSHGTPIDQWLNIRDGGMAIYGGVIAAVLSVLLFCMLSKKRRRKFLPCADLAGLGFLIGQSVGRWGNFFNREAFGTYTDSLLAMRLSEHRLDGLTELKDSPAMQTLRENAVDGFIQVHPTFLYESIWNILGVVLIHFLSKKRKFDGQVFLYYIAWYGLGRVYIEGMRMDSLMPGDIRISQLIAGISCLAAVAILIYMLAIKRPSSEKMLVHCVAAEAAAEAEQVEEEKEEILEETESQPEKEEEEHG